MLFGFIEMNLGHYQPFCLEADKYIYDEENNKANKVVNGYGIFHGNL